MIVSQRHLGERLLVALFLFASGNPTVAEGPLREPVFLALLVSLMFLVLMKNRGLQRESSENFLIIVTFLVIAIVAHVYFIGLQTLRADLAWLLRALCAYLLVHVMREPAARLVEVLIFLAAVSLPLYLLFLVAWAFAPNVYEYLLSVGLDTALTDRTDFLLLVIQERSPYRNAGIFWEPGALGAMLILAVLFTEMKQIVLSRFQRAVLYLSLLSTFSITAYGALVFFEVWRSAGGLGERTSGTLRQVVLRASSIAVIVAVFFLVGLAPKFVELFERTQSQSAGWELSRFGTAVFDWQYIQQRPWLGWGASTVTRYSLSPELVEFRMGNGLTDLVVKWGVLGMLLMSILIFRRLRIVLSRYAAIGCLVVIAMLLFGQQLTNYPFFFLLLFV